MKLHKFAIGSLLGILALTTAAFASTNVNTDDTSVTRQIQRLQAAQFQAEQEAARRPGYGGRAARQRLDQLDGIIEKLQERKPVSPEEIDQSLLR